MVEVKKGIDSCVESTDSAQFEIFMNEISGRKPLDIAFSLALAVRSSFPEVVKLLHAGVTRSRNH
jgi:hypothetical protein